MDSHAYNLITGRSRIRVLRVQPDMNCQISAASLAGAFPSCYGAYDGVATEATDSFTHNLESNDRFEYMTAITGAYSGRIADYSPNGYMYTMDWNYTDARTKLEQWKQGGLVDEQARAVFVDFNVINRLIQSCRCMDYS